MSRIKPLILFQVLSIFAAIEILAIYVGYCIFETGVYEIISEGTPEISVWHFLLIFVAATALFILALKIFRGRLFFEALFSLALFAGIQFVFEIFLPFLWASVFALVVVLLRLHFGRVWVQNLVLIIGLAGVGAALGTSLSVKNIILILIVLAVYDIIAVYKTKHMVGMARGMLDRGVFFFAVIPEKLIGQKVQLGDIQPGTSFMFLGTGDLVLPTMLAVSAIAYGWTEAIGVLAGIFTGVVALHYLFATQEKRRPMPALPPLVTFSILGFLLAHFLA